jgi:hypothetical protein
VNKVFISAILSTALVFSGTAARAVSDGNYDRRRQHCSANADNYTRKQAERRCHNAAIVIADSTGHEYVSAGTLQTAQGHFVHALDVCLDAGQGTKVCALIDKKGGVHDLRQSPGSPAHPETGLHVYFGADDNLDRGEHDSSPSWDDGPSDGGGIQLNVTPQSVQRWVQALYDGDRRYALTHPIPLVDAGAGACADGICFAITTEQRTAFKGDGSQHHDAANYDNKKWDPHSCSGPRDGSKDCGGRSLRSWNRHEGTVYTEPGIQIYEDPDASGSPEGPSYPIPAVYVGTCGVVLGGGKVAGHSTGAPGSPFTNRAGQVVISTGC